MMTQQEPGKVSPYGSTSIKHPLASKGYFKKKKNHEMYYCTCYINVGGTGHLMVTH